MKFTHGVCLIVAIAAALLAQEKPAAAQAADKAPETERLVYTARHAFAGDLLGNVLPVFQSTSGMMLIGSADANSNSVLLSGPPEAVGEALKILRMLDRQPKSVAIDVWIIDAKSSGWEGKANKELNEAMSQSREKFVELLTKLQGQQRLTVVNHLQLTALEGQDSSIQAGERKPRVVSTTTTAAAQRAAERGAGFGGAMSRISNTVTENVGTLFQSTARVTADDQVVLHLTLEKSFIAPDETGVPIAEGADGQVLARSPSISNLVCKNTINLASGQIVELSSTAGGSADSSSDIRVLVGARVLPQAARMKAEQEKAD